MRAVRTKAVGTRFAVATPHYTSTAMAFNCYTKSNCAASASLTALFSLFINSPHLCGLGGDFVSVFQNGVGIDCANGVGKTGSFQDLVQIAKLAGGRIDRRGWRSTMVYGAPLGIERFIQKTRPKLSLSEILGGLHEDAEKGIIRTEGWKAFSLQHREELSRFACNRNWLDALDPENTKRAGANIWPLYEKIRTSGLSVMYDGGIGSDVGAKAAKGSGGLFSIDDFTKFTCDAGEIKVSNFFGARISMYGNYGPWLELITSLKYVEELIRKKGKNLPLSEVSISVTEVTPKINGAIERLGGRFGYSNQNNEDDLANAVMENLAGSETISAPSAGDTVALSLATTDGFLFGLTSSIFTPFGAFLDPCNAGFLLSNRAFSFDTDESSWRVLRPSHAAPHTVNSLIVENDEMAFSLGATGGPVQTQVIVQILYSILVHQADIQSALEAPRAAYTGYSKKHGRAVVLSEYTHQPSDGYLSVGRFSNKLGVCQIAGYTKTHASCFAASDPRGEGAAFAI